MDNTYLMKEYELCFAQLRFYDERHESILKYIFSLATAVATAGVAVYKLLNGATAAFFLCEVLLSGIVFIATLLLGFAMLQNRLYFVYVARQLNAIRGYLMKTAAGEFKDNQMYTSTDFPALKPFSVHTFQLLGAALISAVFAGLCAYSVGPAHGHGTHPGVGLVICLTVFVSEAAGGSWYLAISGRKPADISVHGVKPQTQPKHPTPEDEG